MRRSNARKDFQISKKPVVSVHPDKRPSAAAAETIELPQERGTRILFAIARDSRTICATWNIDWASLFETVLPIDRQVHLRLYGADGVEEKTVPVEPMAAMHYITTLGPHAWYRVEIGYYESAEVWHSVAVSDEIMMPPRGISDSVDVDLATIPFHVAFQQLLDLFGWTNKTGLTRAISQFQNGAMSIEELCGVSAHQKRILRKLRSLVSKMAAARRAFERVDSYTLVRRACMVLGPATSSPSGAIALNN